MTQAPTAIGAPGRFLGYDAQQAALFAATWLPAWSGNNPRELASFYTVDTFYSDPHVPDGVRGREALAAYLERLLARYPDWVWTHAGSTPMDEGFVNFWRARIPVGRVELAVSGVCLVQLRGDLIARNQVYFDRAPLLDAIREHEGSANGGSTPGEGPRHGSRGAS